MSILLCLCIVLALVPATALAEEGKTVSFSVTADKTEAQPGETITFTLTMGPVKGFYYADLNLRIPEGLTYVEGSGSITEGLKDKLKAGQIQFLESHGNILGLHGCDYTSTADTVLMTFQCTVNDDAATGAKTVGAGLYVDDETNCFDVDMDLIAATFTPATVTISGPSAPADGTGTNVEINETNFPDDNFRAYVSDNFDDGDGTLSAAEIAAVTDISCSGKSISDLTGVEHFTALTVLNCGSNQLTTLDVSGNTALTRLDCARNQLTALNLEKNTALKELFCSYNQLTTLDVSGNTALTYLDCNYNQLTTLTLGNTASLTYLYCGANQLTTLDVSGNTALTKLYCDNNQLTTLTLGNTASLTDLLCSDNQLTTLDVSGNTALHCVECKNNHLTSLDLSNTNVITLSASGNTYAITTADGTFDLSTLPGSFDVSKASNWQGGTVSGNILTVNSDATRVTYTYACGKEYTVTFALALEVAEEYTITFDANGGSGEMAAVTGVSGSCTLPACTFTAPEGMRFAGWATSADGEVITDATITVTENTTLYAIWEDISDTTCDETADFTLEDTSHALELLNAAKTGDADSTWADNTLTLNGVNFSTTAETAVKLPAGAKIVLAEGTTNTIASAADNAYMSYGIYATGGLTIEGNGTLTVRSAKATPSSDDGESYGIYADDGDITISGGTVEATGGESSFCSSGIYADNGDITISGGTVIAASGTAFASYGIISDQTITISGGAVNATGGKSYATGYSSGISGRNVIISDGTVTAKGGQESGGNYGIYADEGLVEISGGVVTATGSTASYESYGIYSRNGIISGGVVTATGGELKSGGAYSYGIKSSLLTISGGHVTAQTVSTTGEKSALKVEPDLSKYSGYQWRTSATDEYTASTTTAYTYSNTHTYVEFSNGSTVTTYTVTVQNDGNGSATATPATAAAGTEITLTASPNSGYHFKEWQVVSGTVTIADNKFTMPDSNVTVKAIFEADAPSTTTYTITFNANGGTLTGWTTTETEADGTVDYLSAATREGYTFDGWYTEATGGEKVYTYITKFTADTTVYAHWTLETQTKQITEASFTMDGYTVGANPEDIVVTSNTEGLSLIGGYFEALGKPYSYLLCEVGGEDLVPVTGTLKADKEYILLLKADVDAGYDVSGLTEDHVTLNGDIAAEECGENKWEASIGCSFVLRVLTGNDNPDAKYTITFDANGGSGSMDAVTVVSGSYTLPTCTFTAPEGKQFKGWATSAGGEVISDISITVTDNITLYAVWEDLSEDTNTVTFNPNGGSGSMADVTVVSGDSYTLPSCTFTAPSGKQFKGWATSASGTVISDATITVTENITLYAIWEDIPAAAEYSITVTDGKATVGAGTEISKAAEGTTVTLTANAAPDGKVFDKWVVESGSMTLADENSATTTFTMPAGAVSVKATYKDASHTHNLSLVPATPATCTAPGNKAYYTCDGCDKWFEDATGSVEITDKTSVIILATDHTPSDWKSDADNHWKECTVVGCGVVIDGSTAAHTASDWITDTAATATTDGTKHKECTVCHRVLETGTIPATGSTTNPTNPNTGATTSPQTGDNSNMILWIVLLLVSGLGVTGTVVYSKRKKYVK